MQEGTPDVPGPQPTADLERTLSALAYLLSRPQAHDRQISLAEVRVGRSDLQLLRALAAEENGCRVGDLANRLLVEPSHVTRQVAQLQVQGLVDRSPDPLDRRARNLVITPAGRAVLLSVSRTNQERLREALCGIEDAEISATVKVLRRIIEQYAPAVRATGGCGQAQGA